ncbi:MAG: ankyrin repeat domain-containing protein [Verrucomicrobiae bacterium]|nr:ankyrin repeat domain-containing protein [Verrucomicrobiae bacterium]
MKRTLFVLAVVSMFLQPPTQAAESARLAIISESGETLALADVLTAELSSRTTLHLLERNEIEKAGHELGLSAGNKGDLKLGQLLGADGLLLLDASQEGGDRFLNIRLVAVKPGVVLVAEKYPLPEKGPGEWAAAFVTHLDSYFPKLTVLAKDAIPISVVNLRSALPTDTAKETERQVQLLAIQRLSREPRIFVLERQRMHLLAGEKDLELDDSPFWKGSYLLDGVMDQNGYAKEIVTLNARLIPPKGGAPSEFEVSGARTNLAEVINRLAEKVNEALKIGPPTEEWNADNEAQQYFAEARWALKWRAYSEAQAAAESSWALGRRTKELAELRIRSYREASLFDMNNWAEANPTVPAYAPDMGKLAPAIRALQLYQQDFRYFLMNETRPDTNWFVLALDTLSSTSGLLRRCYYHPESYAGHEDQLSELRGLARETSSLIESQPLYRNLSARHEMFFRGDTDFYLEATPALANVELGLGGFWSETPEECVEIYRKYARTDRLHQLRSYYAYPCLIGWQKHDRQRIPALWSELINELCVCTNALVKVEGYYVAYSTVRRNPDQEPTARRRLFQVAVENAAAFEGAGFAEGLLADINNIIFDSGGEEETARELVFRKNFKTAVGAARKLPVLAAMERHLETNAVFNRARFVEVFYGYRRHTDFQWDPADANTLRPALAAYQERLFQRRDEQPAPFRSWHEVTNTIADFERTLAPAISNVPARSRMANMPRPPATDMTSNSAVQVKRFWRMPDDKYDRNVGRGPDTAINGGCFREGRFWLLVLNGPHKAAIFAVDLNTFETETIEVPPDKIDPGCRFEVLGDFLYYCQGGQISRYALHAKTWEDLDIPLPSMVPAAPGEQAMHGSERIRLSLARGRLFVTTRSSVILELAEDGKKVRILASSRRRPPQNILDTLDGYDCPPIIPGPNQTLRTVIRGKVYTLDESKNEWTESATIPPLQHVITVDVFDEGCLLKQETADSKILWWRLANDKDSLELLLTEPASYREMALTGKPRQRPGVYGAISVEPGRWVHPQNVPLFDAPFCLEGDSLWFFANGLKLVGYSPAKVEVEQQDGSDALLLKFEMNAFEARPKPLQFVGINELDLSELARRLDAIGSGGSRRPTTQGFLAEYRLGPAVYRTISEGLFQATPKGLIVACKNVPGFWLIPKDDSQVQPDGAREQVQHLDPNASLVSAAEAGDLVGVKNALAQGAAVEARNPRGWTALMLAAKRGDLPAVNCLIEKGADANAKSTQEYGNTVLCFAAMGNNPEVVNALLDHGAELNARSGRGASTAFYYAASNGKQAAAAALLARGADVNEFGSTAEFDGRAYTPLMGAACTGYPELVELLLAKGAQLEKKNNFAATALMEAAKYPYVATVKLLIEKGANVNAATPDGYTALIYAAYNGRMENIEALLAAGANPNATATGSDDKPRTAEALARRQHHPEAADLILEAQAQAKAAGQTSKPAPDTR